MRMMRAVLAGAAVAVVTLPSVGLGAPTVHQVVVSGGPVAASWRWEPSNVHAARGDKVVWRNSTTSAHQVLFYGGPLAGKTLQLPTGGKQKLRLKKPGTYLYRCGIQFHSEIVAGTCVGQCGEIDVE